jgi:hypothetical protein
MRPSLLLIAGALVIAVAVGAGPSSAKRSRPAQRPLSYRPVFHAAGNGQAVASSSRYAFVASVSHARQLGWLFDDQTGARIRLARSGCAYTGQQRITGPWLVFDCSSTQTPAPQLYSPTTRSWRSVASNPEFQGACRGSASGCTLFSPVDAGRSWLEVVRTDCVGPGQHCSNTSEFQSLQTGEVRNDPTGGRTIADLNVFDLGRQLCAPLRVPEIFNDIKGYVPGLLIGYGSFAVAQGNHDGGSLYLERCGSRLHRLLTNSGYGSPPPWAANSHEVIWQVTATRLDGLSLPDQRRFSIRVPEQIEPIECVPRSFPECIRQLALTNRHLYMLTDDERLWITKAPVEPRPGRNTH